MFVIAKYAFFEFECVCGYAVVGRYEKTEENEQKRAIYSVKFTLFPG